MTLENAIRKGLCYVSKTVVGLILLAAIVLFSVLCLSIGNVLFMIVNGEIVVPEIIYQGMIALIIIVLGYCLGSSIFDAWNIKLFCKK